MKKSCNIFFAALFLSVAASLAPLACRAQVGHSEHSEHDHDQGHSVHSDHGSDHDHGHQAVPEGLLREVYGENEHTVSHSFVGVAPRFGLALQRGFFAEAGISMDIYRIGYTGASEYVTFNYRNLRPYVSGEILLSGSKLLGGGKAGLEFIMSTPLMGMAVGADASYYTDGPGRAVSITPRLMLSFVYVEVFYGYNIFIHNDLRTWIGPHRFGVSITLNPKFWRRKKAIAEEYYESYGGLP
jgi:hypothetical protein